MRHVAGAKTQEHCECCPDYPLLFDKDRLQDYGLSQMESSRQRIKGMVNMSSIK